MSKSEAVRARIDPEVKAKAEKILGRHGLSHSTFINLTYHAVINQGTVPFSFREPTETLANDIRQARQDHKDDKLQSFSTTQELLDDAWPD